jgi:hypothetical protein
MLRRSMQVPPRFNQVNIAEYALRSNKDILRRVLERSSVDTLDFLPSLDLQMREVKDHLAIVDAATV